MTTALTKHLTPDANASTHRVAVSRAMGADGGKVKPLRAYFELRYSYTIDPANGDETQTASALFPSGTYAALDFTPTWAHHRFVGWFPNAAVPSADIPSTTGEIEPEDSVVFERSTVYAHWQLPTTVTFDATSAGGTMPGGWTAPDYYAGQPYGTLPTPTKSGEVFLGWFTPGGVRVTASSTVPQGGVALAARFTAVTYATSYEATTTSSYKKTGIYSATSLNSSNPTVVDWGDGNVDVVYGSISQLVHEYATTGAHTVRISDTISTFALSTNNSTWYQTTSQNQYTVTRVTAMSSHITSLASYGFYYCQAMTAFVYPASTITSIPTYHFYYCIKLNVPAIPATVTSIGSYAFAYINQSQFSSITIPASVTSIGSSAFYYCYYLRYITFETGTSTLTLNSYAFAYTMYYSKASIDLSPRPITSIPSNCFYYCRYLNSVTFPTNATFTSIGNYAFYYCWYFQTGTCTIPDHVTSIGQYAFGYCYYLTAITIPASVTSIGGYAFYYCQRLQTIICLRTTAPTTNYATFGYSTYNYTGRTYYSAGTNRLRVPAGATGYTSSYWLNPLCQSSMCGFTLEEIQ